MSTLDGLLLRATTPKGVSPIIDPTRCPCRLPGLTLASRSYPRVDPWHHGEVSARRQGVVVVVVVVVVEWLYYSNRIIIVRWADLSDFFRSFS